MTDKLFYIRGYHRVVYCHKEENNVLTLGSLSNYLTDAKTGIYRQAITRQAFDLLKPVEIDENKLDSYRFLEMCSIVKSWRVTNGDNGDVDMIKTAIKLPPVTLEESMKKFQNEWKPFNGFKHMLK